MDNTPLNERLKAELARLALLSEEEIDTSDVPEVTDWSLARRGAFYEGSIKSKNYDVRSIANWFLDRLQILGVSVSNLFLNKVVYFSVERALVERAILLTPARIEAWDHGPVFREIYHAFKGNANGTIRERIERFSIADRRMIEAKDAFFSDDLAFFETIAQTYGRQRSSRLWNLAHEKGGPWDSVWSYRGIINPGMEITPKTILRKAPSRRSIND